MIEKELSHTFTDNNENYIYIENLPTSMNE